MNFENQGTLGWKNGKETLNLQMPYKLSRNLVGFFVFTALGR